MPRKPPPPPGWTSRPDDEQPDERPRRRPSPADFKDASRGERLQKVLANAGIAARRDCEKIIEDGRVTINDQKVDFLPAWVNPEQDRIKVDGQPVVLPRTDRAKAQKLVYIALHKPRNTITTTDDPHGRRTVLDLVELPPQMKQRVYPVGRLDNDSTGLILLTNDGELAHRLTHPSYEIAKRYEVSVRGRLEQADVDRLRKGLYLSTPKGKAKKAAAEEVVLIGYQQPRKGEGTRTRLRITLTEGQNREVRRLLARLGFKVRRLERIGIGPLSVKGLGAGQWRPLEPREVRKLRSAVGMEDLKKKPRRATQKRESE